MVWVKLDDRFPEHKKVANLSDRAFRTHVSALCYCARELTDGVITEQAALRICGGTRAGVRTLVDAGLWRTRDGGRYLINDFLAYNPTGEEVEELRKQRSEAGKKGATRRWGDSKRHDKNHGGGYSDGDGKPMANTMPRDPGPDLERNPSAVDGTRKGAQDDGYSTRIHELVKDELGDTQREIRLRGGTS